MLSVIKIDCIYRINDMAKKEAKTDLWVYDLLNEADIELDPQGCSIHSAFCCKNSNINFHPYLYAILAFYI